jgi:hypothetical protein
MRTRFAKFSSSLAFAALSFWSFSAMADDECDPSKILRSDVSQFNEHISVFLALQRLYTNDINAGHNANAGFVYDGFPISGKDAGTFAQAIHDSTNFSVNDDETVSILKSTLSQASVDAYIACVNHQHPPPVSISFPPQSLTETQFQFKVHWHPDYLTPKEAELVLTITNGTVDGKTKVRKPIRPTEEIILQVVRDDNGSKRLIMSAWVWGKASDILTLPPLPTFEVKLRPKLSEYRELCRSGGCGTAPVTFGVHIIPDGESQLLPDSLQFVLAKMVGNPNDVFVCPDPNAAAYPHHCDSYRPENNNPFLVTGEFRAPRTVANEANDFISGQFMALETVVTPISVHKPAIGGYQKIPDKTANMNAVLMEASPYPNP